MEFVLYWKGDPFYLKVSDKYAFQHLAMAFLAKKPKGLAPGSIGRIRLLHRGVELDMNQILSTYDFRNDFSITVVDVDRTGESIPLPLAGIASLQASHVETKIQVYLVNVISKAIYNQVVSNYSLVSRIIENLRITLNVNYGIALFNENGLLIPSQTLQANGIVDGDTIGILYYSFPNLEMLDLRDIRIPWFPKKSKFSEILRATPRSISDRLVFSFSLRQASDLRSVIMLLASHPIVSISLDQAVEGIELRPDADKAQQTQFFQKIRSVTFSWNSVQQLPLDAFFSLLPQFSFSSLSTLSIVNPLLADADLRSLTYLLQSHNLPLYVLINDSPLHAVSSFQEQVAAVQQSSQQLVQSLKQELEATKTQVAEKTAELRGLVDANLALKQELGKLQEAAKEAAEAEGKRKAECETLIAQIGKLNSQAAAEAETAKGREENLTIALGAARETVEKVVHALQTLQTGFQQLVSSGAFQSGPLQWNVRNVSGAANFAINQLVELSKSVGTSVGKEEE